MALLSDRAGRAGEVRKAVGWVAPWILLSTWCTLSGWILSLLGALNEFGYGISFLLFLVGIWLCREWLGLSDLKLSPFRIRPLYSRFWLPKAWLLLATLVFIGGLIYHPSNYDYLAYRFPRLLHWVWEQRWHWIYTSNSRMNLMGPDFEWLMAPIFIFFKTDRLFFLINIISFLILPGLVYSVLCQVGISKRMSWWWMWVLPCGYCYVLQAASLSNDLLAAVYTLSAFHFILKTNKQEASSSTNFLYSCLSIALATGSKASNIPLALPWLIAVFIQRSSVMKIKPIVLAGILLVSGGVSALPTLLLNISYTGAYSGDPNHETQLELSDPIGGLVGNSILLAIDNLRPPIWPAQVPLNVVLPQSVIDYLMHAYPRISYKKFAVDEIQMEESGGIGVGIMACFFLMMGLRWWAGVGHTNLVVKPKTKFLPILIGAWIAVLVLMAKLGNEGMARMLTPYYPLLIAGVLIGASLDGTVIRFLICRLFAGFAIFIALLLVIISPARPLYPTAWAAYVLEKISPSRVARFERVYDVYHSRYDAMKDLRILLPDTEKSVGYIQTGDNPEASLWRPYGSRQIIDVLPSQSLDQLKANHIHLVVAGQYALDYTYKVPLDELLKKWSATVVAERGLDVRASTGPETWYIIALP